MASKDIELLKQKITEYLTDINTLRKNSEILNEKAKELEGNLNREKSTNKKLLEEKQILLKELEEIKAAISQPRVARKPGKAPKTRT